MIACTKIIGVVVFPATSIGFNLSISNPFFFKIVPLTILSIPPTINPGKLKLRCFLTNSLANLSKSAKGESKQTALTLLSLWVYIMPVAAPIDRPHSPIFPTPGIFSTKSITFPKSWFSWYPKDIYSPSDKPLPAKSNMNKFISRFRRTFAMFKPSILDEELPWRYITTGILVIVRNAFVGSMKEHFNM